MATSSSRSSSSSRSERRPPRAGAFGLAAAAAATTLLLAVGSLPQPAGAFLARGPAGPLLQQSLSTSASFASSPKPFPARLGSLAAKGFGFGKGQGAARRNATGEGEADPQLLYYHQKKTTEVASSVADATQFLRFNSQPRQPPPGMRVFDRVLDFPCIFDIKVIGEPTVGDEGSFDRDMVQLVGEVTGKEAGEITYSSRDTSSGRYRSLTIQCPVQNADQLYAIYDRISQDARVKFKF